MNILVMFIVALIIFVPFYMQIIKLNKKAQARIDEGGIGKIIPYPALIAAGIAVLICGLYLIFG